MLKTNAILFLIFFASIMTTSCQKEASRVPLPVIEGAYEIDKKYSKKNQVDYVGYKVNIDFPAKKVVQFYSDALKKSHFIKYYGDKLSGWQWESFNYSSGYWEPTDKKPGQFIASWVDKDRNLRALLTLGYKYDGLIKENNDILFVDFKIAPFSLFEKDIKTHKNMK